MVMTACKQQFYMSTKVHEFIKSSYHQTMTIGCGIDCRIEEIELGYLFINSSLTEATHSVEYM